MHRFLERLDASASTLVPLLYLGGLMLGAIAYFAGLTLNFELAVGIALASAVELHSFLQQRRARATYARLARLTEDDAEYEVARKQFKVNVWILVGLLSFSAFNSIAFIYETWTPAPGPLVVRWVQIIVRGLVIPALFFAAGFLVPLHIDASDQLRATSAEMLRRTLKAIDRQWRARLKRAEKRSADLAPVAIALLQEAGDHAAAKRIELITGGLIAAEQGAPLVALASAAQSSTPPAPTLPPTPPEPERPARRLSPREERRLQLERDMRGELMGVRAHPTTPGWRGYDTDEDTDEDSGDASALNSAEDEDDWGTSRTRRSNGHKSAPAARRTQQDATLVLDEWADESFDAFDADADGAHLTFVPSPIYEDDSPEGKRIIRYLNRHPDRAKVAYIMERLHFPKVTASKWVARWNDRQPRPSHLTQELPIVLPQMAVEAETVSAD